MQQTVISSPPMVMKSENGSNMSARGHRELHWEHTCSPSMAASAEAPSTVTAVLPWSQQSLRACNEGHVHLSALSKATLALPEVLAAVIPTLCASSVTRLAS